ncbi:MAG: hypothetical protein MJ188_08750 [Treponema sp.]|nr:hypothetical protein [Treponema sp.]
MNKRAIIHVENTEGVINFSRFLSEQGWTILSANKTEELLKREQINVIREPSLMGNNLFKNDLLEILEQIANTRYYENQSDSIPDDKENGCLFIICMNINPVILPLNSHDKNSSQNQLKTLSKPESFFVSKIIRSAFENYENILILTDPDDYKEAMIQIRTNNITDNFRLKLAAKALNLISAYDSSISSTILMREEISQSEFMNYLMIPFKKQQVLEHGANPQQAACLYKFPTETGIMSGLQKMPEKSLNYNLIADVSYAWELVSSVYLNLKNQFTVKSTNRDGYEYTTQFTPQTGTVYTVAVKYKSILGASLATNVTDSFKKTFCYDTNIIDNSVIASSSVIDDHSAELISKQNFAAIVAPGFTQEAKDILSANKNIQLISTSNTSLSYFDMDLFSGGILFQTKDINLCDHWHIKTQNRPKQELCDKLLFGMNLTTNTHTHSAILLRDNYILGIAQGCKSQIRALQEVILDAKEFSPQENSEKNDVLICDTPIPNCNEIRELIERGVTAIIQPGGSQSDQELIQYCDDHNITLIFTNMTHISY